MTKQTNNIIQFKPRQLTLYEMAKLYPHAKYCAVVKRLVKKCFSRKQLDALELREVRQLIAVRG